MLAILATTLILRLWRQTDQNEEETNYEQNLGEHIKIDIRNQVCLPVPPWHKIPQVLDTSSYMSGVSPQLKNEVQPTTSGIANDESRATSWPAKQPIPQAAVGERETQRPVVKTAFKVASWVIAISAGGIVSVLVEILGKEKTELNHIVLLKAYTTLNYISLLFAIGLFILTLKRPNIRGLVMIVKFIMWLTIGSITYSLGCATSLVLPKSSVEEVLILVVPLVVVFLIIILSLGSRTY